MTKIQIPWPAAKTFSILALYKLDPRKIYRNPPLFLFGIGAILLSTIAIKNFIFHQPEALLNLQFSLWSLATLYAIGMGQVISERSGMLRAENLMGKKKRAKAKLVRDTEMRDFQLVDARRLSRGDIILVEAGDVIPVDGEVIEGIASVDESAITGESAPVLRENGGSRSAVTGGTKVVSDYIYIEVSGGQGSSFLDQMLGMVDSRARQKTSSEISFDIITAIFSGLIIFVAIVFFAVSLRLGHIFKLEYFIITLMSLLPISFSGLVPAVIAAGMNRLVAYSVIIKSSNMIENAGEISLMFLDKTGTITLGNRIAHEFIPLKTSSMGELAEYALTASWGDSTMEGKSIMALAQSKYSIQETNLLNAEIIAFNSQSRISGVNYRGKEVRKGAPDVMLEQAGLSKNDSDNSELLMIIEKIAMTGGTPMPVSLNKKILGVIHLKDVIKAGMKERFQRLRKLGVKTIMLTGDSPLTAAALSAEAGVDDFVAECTPENKMLLIEKEQAAGKQVAMCGDGTNDAPALARANIGLVMNNGTQAARDAGNILDLDSDPTKLVEIISVGRQLLVTRAALFVFSISVLLGKYLVLLPMLLKNINPNFAAANFLGLSSLAGTLLATAILNFLIIILLTPLMLQGVYVKDVNPGKLLLENLIMFGMGGLIVTLIGAMLINWALTALVGII